MISEVSPMNGSSSTHDTGEFIELYNPLSTDVLFGANVQMVSGNTSGTNNAEWQLSLSGMTVKAYGFLLIGDGGVSVTPDASFPSGKNLSNSGIRSCVQLRDGATVIDAFAWDASTTLQGEGTRFTPSGTSSDGKTFERKSSSSASGPDLLGNAWDTNDNAADFFENAAANANPQNSSSAVEVNNYSLSGDGSGKLIIDPATVKKNTINDEVLKFVGEGIDSLSLCIPSPLSWSKSLGDVSVSSTSGTTVSKTILGDTLYFGNAGLQSSDTLTVVIATITAPDSIGSFTILTKSATNGGSLKEIGLSPALTTYGIVPISSIHINDSQGVPAPPFQIGASVTISGIITADLNATRTDIYVQDETGGASVFSFDRPFNYQIGDSITLTGTITQYRGLTEITPDSTTIIIHSHGRPVPEPKVVTAAEVNATYNTDDNTEPNEGRLVRLNNVTYNASTSTITDGSGTTETYLPPYTPPTGAFDLIGVIKQYKPGSTDPGAPYKTDYEVVPRMQSDIILYAGPIFSIVPHETNIHSDKVTISWETETASTSVLRFGPSPAVWSDSVVSLEPAMQHNITLNELSPSTIYYYQVSSTDTSGTTTTGKYFFISGSVSNGTINVYFSKSTNPSVALSETARTKDLSSVLLARINAAQHSIDFCTYSLSGTVGANIASAMIAAKNRGVSIRVIGEKDNQGTAPWSTLKNGGITVIDDGYDVINGGKGLMHNKFFVFDYRDTSSATDDWVVTGSWNATDPGTNNDAQNLLEIEDQSLAAAYTMEFNEMWGSSTNTPNQTLSRFGARKTNNTPHQFSIGGVPIQLYFSPSDQVTSHINGELNTATASIDIAMLTFTRDELAQTLIEKKADGVKVHVILDNNSDLGNEFSTLQSGGVDILLKASSLGGLLHHKYAVVDGENPTAPDPAVITGSHNWSSSAETSNNENTLIIHSKRIANLYLQEFKQRYIDAGGSDNIVLTVIDHGQDIPSSYALSQNYPNPFNPSTTINFSIPANRFVSLKIYDIIGREIATLVNQNLSPGYYTVRWNASGYSSGVYFYQLRSGNFTQTKKLLLQK